MDHRRFDRLTTALVSETGRRRAIGGMLAGTAAVFGQRMAASAKKRKKKCTGCPQRACCSCREVAPNGPATKCITFEGVSDLNDAQELCIAFCGSADLLFKFNFQVPSVANFCAANFDCTVKQCPVKLKA